MLLFTPKQHTSDRQGDWTGALSASKKANFEELFLCIFNVIYWTNRRSDHRRILRAQLTRDCFFFDSLINVKNLSLVQKPYYVHYCIDSNSRSCGAMFHWVGGLRLRLGILINELFEKLKSASYLFYHYRTLCAQTRAGLFFVSYHCGKSFVSFEIRCSVLYCI